MREIGQAYVAVLRTSTAERKGPQSPLHFLLVTEGLQGLIMAADVGPRQPDDEAASRLFGTQNGKRAQCEGVSSSNQNLNVPK